MSTTAESPVHPATLELWQRAGVIHAVGTQNVFDTVHEAEHMWAGAGPAPAEKRPL